jgi:hypothetical protein
MVRILDLGECEYKCELITFIAQQVVGNNVHELTVGAHVKCKAYQRRWLKLSFAFKIGQNFINSY